MGRGAVDATAAVEAVAADALALCAIAAPTGQEEARAVEVAERLRAAGAGPWRDAAGSVLVRFGPEPSPERPAAIVTAHLDTVFGADTPLHPHRDGDTLRGPGIGDDSLGLAGLLHLAGLLVAGPAPARPVVLAATVGEEGLGDLRGAHAVLDAIPCDAFVALEGHGLETVQTIGVASARLLVRATGPGGHSWGDRGTPSAIHALVLALEWARTTVGAAHFNIGVIRGGTSINTIAAEAEAQLDLRDLDDAALSARVDALRSAMTDAELGGSRMPGTRISVEIVGRRPGGATPGEHPLVQAARAARAGAGLAPAEEVVSSTDANAAMGRGIAAISISLTTGAHAHRLEEHVHLGPLAGGLRAAELLLDALSRNQPRGHFGTAPSG